MNSLYGVDGCKNKWVVIEKDLDTQLYLFHLWTTYDLFHSHPTPQVIAIDIPIGLPNQGYRQCDFEARKRLGKRSRSVFPAPIRPILDATTRLEADIIRRKIENKGVSHQTFGLIPKIHQVDQELRQNPELQTRVWEIHPEVCFYYLAGEQPMNHSKKIPAGFEERYQKLKAVFGQYIDKVLNELQKHAGRDDILDAFAALWTAKRIASGSFEMIPPSCPKDSFGLRMAIVA